MATVKPFRALRPKPEFAKEVAAPPYDVLSAGEAREIVKHNPNSFLRVNKAELEFDNGADPYSAEVYRRGKENLWDLESRGLMIRDPRPCFYLYRLTMGEVCQTGLVALTSVAEYDKEIIKKHEHTRPEKVSDRANHIACLNAQVGPVFLTYRASAQINEIFAELTGTNPEIDFTADDGVRHEFWVIESADSLDEIQAAFGKIPHLYIADGHHRSEAASEVCRRKRIANPRHNGSESYNYFLTVIFPDAELKILPYNRVVRDLNGLSARDLLDRAGEWFEVESLTEALAPEIPRTFGIYLGGRWFRLTSRDGSFDPDDPTGSIDAAILQSNFIDPLLGIKDPKTDTRIKFIGGIRGTAELEKLVDSGEFAIAFSLCPTTISQLLEVADAGQVMPPKSTWFEPKLRSGMAVYIL